MSSGPLRRVQWYFFDVSDVLAGSIIRSKIVVFILVAMRT
jgi:hypothetical protein